MQCRILRGPKPDGRKEQGVHQESVFLTVTLVDAQCEHNISTDIRLEVQSKW